MRTLMILGPPGAGKSTLSLTLQRTTSPAHSFAVRLLATQLASQDSALGGELKNILAGPLRLIPDPLIARMFERFLERVEPSALLLLEGFPISAPQFEIARHALAMRGRRIDLMVHLLCSPEALRRRIAQRLVCPSCESRRAAGVPLLPPCSVCPDCGGTLASRPDDASDHYDRRMRLYQREMPVILSGVEPCRVIQLDTERLDPEAVASLVLRYVEGFDP